jgi:photosystem II stability/assembly factor-like uncharacterized protein
MNCALAPIRALLGFALILPAASSHAASGPPALDDVLGRNLSARGGAQALHALHDLHLAGTIVLGGGGDFHLEAEWQQQQERGGHYREEITLQGLTAISAFDGQNGWAVDPFGGRRDATRSSADDAKTLAQAAELDGPLVDWQKKGHRVELLGREDVDGTLAYKLRVLRKDGDMQYVFLDPDTFLEIRITTQHHVRGAEHISETDLGNYEQVAGVWIPFSRDSGAKGAPRSSHLTIDRAQPNVAGATDWFRYPATGTHPERVLNLAKTQSTARATPPAKAVQPGRIDAGVLSGLGARNIGSATMSGRVAAVAGVNEQGKTTLYVGAASGGVWKSTDGGTSFKPVFDKNPVLSIGAITIDPSHPQTVWVGTGEAWTRNSVSIGNGIYRSQDGGDTWSHMGLPESERIVRILVHPKQSDTVYACVPGKLWSDSADRGLYKTVDGGKTWSLILRGDNLSTGCSSVTMDPKNPNVLLAGLWDFRRKGWTFRSGGDSADAKSGSRLVRSSDGGKTWAPIDAGTAKGLPGGPWGRVEVTIAPSNPKVVYAFIESKDAALYRSSDGGKTWEARDRSQHMVWRPFYFARLVVDPKMPDRVFKPDLNLIVSEDGGRSFTNSNGGSHGDWHDLWIDPDNTRHIVGGDDGGLWISWDGGNRWWKSGNLPISQFYHVSVDMRDPYQVYGGLQDNSSWVGDSQFPGGITNSRWENLYNGDGFWTLVDPTDPDAVYAEGQGGFIGRVDRRTHAARDIQPKAAFHEKLRYNWNTPISVSPTQRGTLYMGAQFLFRSRDRGDNWERISPDLTTNDPEKQKQEQSGGITVDNSAAEMHTTIYSISESPRDPNVIWVGTDDGNLQLSRDGGKHWTNVVANVPTLPKNSWVSWVEASRFDAGTAYAVFDRHTFGDMTPQAWRTRDFGRTWQRVVSPDQGVRGYAHVLKEDTVSPSLLFLGTEFGLWISVDGGAAWNEWKGGDFPSVAVRDLQVHPRDGDLVMATHGRGIWIIDDLTPLRSLAQVVHSGKTTFVPDRPIQQRMPASGGWPEGDAAYSGDNPAPGASITYYQPSRHIYGPLKLEVLDDKGRLVDTLTPTKRPGLNRVEWSMQVKPPRVPRAAQVAFGASQGPRVVPGSYTVRLTSGTQTVESKLTIAVDRRAPYGTAERAAQFAAVMRAHALFETMSRLVDRIEAARTAAQARLAALPKGDALSGKVAALAQHLDATRNKVVATKEGGAITGEERIREHLDHVYGALMTWEGKPAGYQVERIAVLARELDEVDGELKKLTTASIEPIDRLLMARGLAPIRNAMDQAPPALAAPDVVARALRCLPTRSEGCTNAPTAATAAARESD